MNAKLKKEIERTLSEMEERGEYIALSLNPPKGNNIIEKEGNRMFVNEGRKGQWDNVSESFYDEMVRKYDSRDRIKD